LGVKVAFGGGGEEKTSIKAKNKPMGVKPKMSTN
jgi:hypothetical protein